MTLLNPPAAFSLETRHMTGTAREFWLRTNSEVLPYQRCASCSDPNFPPLEWCRSCLSTDLVWEESSGTGVLESWSVVWRPVSPQFVVPYAPAIVELAEGFRMVSCIVGDDEDLHAGAKVALEFAGDSSQRIPVFRVVKGQ
jgi:hypothetical protein